MRGASASDTDKFSPKTGYNENDVILRPDEIPGPEGVDANRWQSWLQTQGNRELANWFATTKYKLGELTVERSREFFAAANDPRGVARSLGDFVWWLLQVKATPLEPDLEAQITDVLRYCDEYLRIGIGRYGKHGLVLDVLDE